MNFVTIDVETANPNMGSICQIGIAKFAHNELVDEWVSLVDPEEYFDDVNTSIHGIGQSIVRGKPKLPALAQKLHEYLDGTITVCHTHFDRIAIARAFAKYKMEPISNSWLDSSRVVRRTWKDLAYKGYGLSNVCRRIGYEFKHHDALEDAKAAGHVLLAAFRESQMDIDAWVLRVNQPISETIIHREGNPDGDLFGEVLVFTGALELLRSEAAELAASIGCQVAENVTKKTTLLVIGDQDFSKLAGFEKSSKHRKAEQMIADRYPIRIILETDFKTLVKSANRGRGYGALHGLKELAANLNP